MDQQAKPQQNIFKQKHYKSAKQMWPIKEARKRAYRLNYARNNPPEPSLTGIKVIKNVDLEAIKPFINWKMFFYAWGIKGKFPEILELENKKGKEARRLYEEGQEMLQDIITHKKVQAKAVTGIFPAAAKADDIVVYRDESRKYPKETLTMLRQQTGNRQKPHFYSLSDFIAPEDSGIRDYIGTFAASVGFGAEKYIEAYQKEGDSYNSVMFRLLCDRLTEAFSELLHLEVRNKYWGYANESIGAFKDLLEERFDGIRPVPGYPACPDHSKKASIFRLMQVEKNIGIRLTQSYAMHPASSVCGFYFARPEARYFNIGQIDKDQIKDYAKRRKMPMDKAEMLFKPYLSYSTD